jgi:nitroimidazol reductase NimA-like FMN-containing flavoprotein (pyridoxamine 5'-phosphate oxidase superfamily)
MTDSILAPVSQAACLQYLKEGRVGRIGFVIDGDPVILPVNYRLVEPASGPLLVVRTRPGHLIEHAPVSVAFEIDSIDVNQHHGWSVLVRGELIHANPTSREFVERYDPDSWLADAESWLVIDPWTVTGRELHAAGQLWPYRPGEYM